VLPLAQIGARIDGMMSPSSRLLARGAAAAAAVLVTSGLAAVAGAPAGAVSATLSYDCTALSGPEVMTAVVDTDAPASMLPGQTASINVTSTVTISAARADLVRGANITQVDGSVAANMTVDGVPRAAALAFPRTDVPPTMGTPLPVVATGPGGSIQAGVAGTTIELGAGNFSIHIVGYDASNTVKGQDTWNCTLQALQPLHVDSVLVGIATTTTFSVSSTIEYGDAATVSANVATAGTNAKPDGIMEFAFVGKTVKATVKGGKAKATLPAALTMGVSPVTATFTPSDPNLASSQASKNVTVVRDQTTTTASAIYRAARDRLVGKGKVVAQHGTAVTGKVTFVLKRDGVKIRTALIGVNKFGAAKKVFKNVSKAGRYTVVARYLGSPTLKRSVDRAKLVV
jgi:hypothetical protein